jgi:hypothetical protein
MGALGVLAQYAGQTEKSLATALLVALGIACLQLVPAHELADEVVRVDHDSGFGFVIVEH